MRKEKYDEAVENISSRLRFPINHYIELLSQVGESICIENREYKLDKLKRRAESRTGTRGWFPIQNRQDFKNKSTNFFTRDFIGNLRV